ncbi:MAG: queuosine precursor transporter [bacterium]
MSEQRSWLIPFTIVSAAYIGAQMMADIASLRIVTIAGFSVDAGTLIYPFTFTLRDLVHKTGGRRAADTLVITAGGINLLMAGLFSLVAWLPADLSVGPQLEFGMVLGPVWRIVIASIVAEVTAELVDGAVYQRWVNRFGMKRQWLRVLVSNGFSAPLDSALFVALAFIGRMGFGVVVGIFVANVVIKYAVSVVSMPMIYLVRERNPAA